MNVVVWNHQGKDKADADVRYQADDQWWYDSSRYRLAGITSFFTCRRYDVEADKSVEAGGSTGEHL